MSRRRWLRLVGLQWLHAGLILVFPTVSVGLAAWQWSRGEVRTWMPLLAGGLYVATMLGITVGYHRLLAHRAFTTSSSTVVALLTILGAMAIQGAPIYWVSNHRRHHRYADVPGDPHSPHCDEETSLSGWRGFFHAHVGWTFSHELTSSVEFSRDLLQNAFIGHINRRYWTWVALSLALPTCVGLLVTRSVSGAMQGLVWGGGVRLFLSYHLTNSINSVTHLFGYRTHATDEQSRNNLWLGAITLGEAWHNNHHAFPTSARFGARWWELDAGWLLIRFLEKVGLVNSVRKPADKSVAVIVETPAMNRES